MTCWYEMSKVTLVIFIRHSRVQIEMAEFATKNLTYSELKTVHLGQSFFNEIVISLSLSSLVYVLFFKKPDNCLN